MTPDPTTATARRRITRGFVLLCLVIGLLTTIGGAGAWTMATAFSSAPVRVPAAAWPQLAEDGALTAWIDSGLLQVHEVLEDREEGRMPRTALVRLSAARATAFFDAIRATGQPPPDATAAVVEIAGDPDAALQYGILGYGPALLAAALLGAWLGCALFAMLATLAVRRFWDFLTPDWQK